MKTPLHKLFIIESAVVVIVIIALLFAKKVVANDTRANSLSFGLTHTNGQTDLLDQPNIKLWEAPLSLLIKRDKFYYGVQLKYRASKTVNSTQQGIGDSVISLGYQAHKQFQISLSEKIANTNKPGLSNGVNSTSLQVDFNRQLMNAKRRLVASIGYTFHNDSADYDLQNRAYISLGTHYLINNRTRIGVSLNYQENIFADLDDQLGLQATLNQPLSENYSLSAFAGYDNTQTSNIGVSLTGKF